MQVRDARIDGLRKAYRDEQPLAGAEILGCIHMTIQTVLIETLVELGAEFDSSCNIFFADRGRAIAAASIPVCWKVKQRRYEWCIKTIPRQ